MNIASIPGENRPNRRSRNLPDNDSATRSAMCFSGPRDSLTREVTLVERTEGLLRGLVMVLEHHHAPPCILQALDQQVHRYLDNSESEGVWLKRAKYLLTYPKALYLRNEPPKKPDQVFEPSGALRRWMQNRLRVFNNANTHLWYSWLQTKRAALPVSDKIIQETFNDHQSTLIFKKDDGDDTVIDGVFEQPAFQVVMRSVQDELLNLNLDLFDGLEPSKSAAWGYSRKDGGSQGALLELLQFDESVNVREPILMKMVYVPFCARAGRGIVKEVYEPLGRDIWQGLKRVPTSQDILSCTIQAVLEPMKVRVISKGEALPYYRMRLLQKALHGALRRIPCFRLIGRPFCPTDVIDLRRRARRCYEWFSVDYSAATDNLSFKYAGRIFRELITVLPEEKQREALAVLGFHKLHYPTKGNRKFGEYRGTMVRGQLMGSILSFPILCLANLGVYLYTNRLLHREWPIGDILNHVLINGDDMLYAAPPNLWEEHIRVGKAVGLEMSVGKAYHHPVYSNINSVACLSDLRRPNAQTRRIDFLNTGLFFGQKEEIKLEEETAQTHHDGELNKSSIFNEVMRGCFRKHDEVARMFLSRHRKALEEEARLPVMWSRGGPDPNTLFVNRKCRKVVARNYFLPVSIGGLGMTCPAGIRYRVTSDQKKLAAGLIKNYLLEGVHLDTQRPTQGPEAAEVLLVPKQPWSRCFARPEDKDALFVSDVSLGEQQYLFKLFRHGFLYSVRNRHHVLH